MGSYNVLIFLIYLFLGIYIIPKRGLEFDLYKMKFRLLPHWFKLVALSWIVFTGFGLFFISNNLENRIEYFVASLNLSQFVFLFSKQREEDEFSEQIRFKSFTTSFVYFIALAGAFSVIDIQSKADSILNSLNLQIFLGVSLFSALLYFYITLFKVRKSK